jgi:hypothetical protein
LLKIKGDVVVKEVKAAGLRPIAVQVEHGCDVGAARELESRHEPIVAGD